MKDSKYTYCKVTGKVLGMNPDYLNKNNLWDTDWLKEKYPERFSDSNDNEETDYI